MKQRLIQKTPALVWFILGMATYFIANRLVFVNIEDSTTRLLIPLGFIVVIAVICVIIDNFTKKKLGNKD